MWFAFLNGIFSILTILVLNRWLFDLTLGDIARLALVSNFAGLTALLSILTLQRSLKIKKNIIKNPLTAWTSFIAIYLAILLPLTHPLLWDVKKFFVLIAPVFWTMNFSFFLFAPIQDRIIYKLQKKSTR